MVMAPNEPMRVLGQSDESEAHERRLLKDEAASAIRCQILLQPKVLLRLGKSAPVLLVPRKLDSAVDQLHWPVQLLPVESRPQRGMPIHHALPSLLKMVDL